MTRLMIAALILLNLLLGGAVWMRLTTEKTAVAQIGNTPSDYAVVSSTANNRFFIYLLKVSTGQLAALEINANDNRLDVRNLRSVGKDLARLKP